MLTNKQIRSGWEEAKRRYGDPERLLKALGIDPTRPLGQDKPDELATIMGAVHNTVYRGAVDTMRAQIAEAVRATRAKQTTMAGVRLQPHTPSPRVPQIAIDGFEISRSRTETPEKSESRWQVGPVGHYKSQTSSPSNPSGTTTSKWTIGKQSEDAPPGFPGQPTTDADGLISSAGHALAHPLETAQKHPVATGMVGTGLGTAIGAGLGSAVPGIGTGAGALIGNVIGGGASNYGSAPASSPHSSSNPHTASAGASTPSSSGQSPKSEDGHMATAGLATPVRDGEISSGYKGAGIGAGIGAGLGGAAGGLVGGPHGALLGANLGGAAGAFAGNLAGQMHHGNREAAGQDDETPQPHHGEEHERLGKLCDKGATDDDPDISSPEALEAFVVRCLEKHLMQSKLHDEPGPNPAPPPMEGAGPAPVGSRLAGDEALACSPRVPSMRILH